MRKYKTVQREEQQLESVVCDICGAVATDHGWSDSATDYVYTQVGMSEGEYFPETYVCTNTFFDICASCFRRLLMPWLAEQGAEPTVVDSE